MTCPFLSLPTFPFLFRCSRCGTVLGPKLFPKSVGILCNRPKGCPPPRTLAHLEQLEALMLFLMKVLLDAVPDLPAFLRELSEQRERNRLRADRSDRIIAGQLEDRLHQVTSRRVRLDRDREEGALEEDLMQALEESYAREEARLREKLELTASRREKGPDAVTEEELRDAMLRAVFVFFDRIELFPRIGRPGVRRSAWCPGYLCRRRWRNMPPRTDFSPSGPGLERASQLAAAAVPRLRMRRCVR